ncbi:transposase [Petrotoga olearia]|uniref:transposase n=1 Tax=Petrotoga olearia TaxID=156203 RepID=UPI002481AB57|nr:transposase [Petrotoga olearia]
MKTDDGTKTVEVPWARKNSGFTLLFEVFILELYNHMTVAEIAKKYNTTQNRLWRILDFYVSKDMSVPFKAGAKKHFPKAKIIFDKFHVLNVLSDQLDKVRARENKGYHEILKRTKYLLLKNPNNLTKKDKVRLNETPRKGFKEEQHLDTVQAYGLVLEFKKMFDYKKPSYAAKYFEIKITPSSLNRFLAKNNLGYIKLSQSE